MEVRKVLHFIRPPQNYTIPTGTFSGDYAISACLEDATGFVYFIQVGEFGPIKIGFSSNPQSRLNELQVANPYPLRLLYFRPESETTEKLLHSRFMDLRMSGEWFHPHNHILKCIEEFRRWDEKDKAYEIKCEEKYASGEWERP